MKTSQRSLTAVALRMSHPVTVTSIWDEHAVLPNAAIIYGLKELARRAGVSDELYDSWQFKFDDAGCLKVFVKPGTRKQIRFHRASDQFWVDLQAGMARTSTATWLKSPSILNVLVPDFKVPFSSSDRAEIGPLFSMVDDDCFDCPVDLLASIVLTLARFEEILPAHRDEHGRFTAFSSIAWRNAFLHRPIVDEYGLALEEALTILLPGWSASPRVLQVNLGHDVDDVGIPFSFRATAGHTLRRRHPIATATDLFAHCTGMETAYQRLLRKLVQMGLNRGFYPAIYWKQSDPGPHDTGYDLRDSRNRQLISAFQSSGLELGVHLSYDSFESPERFRKEVSALRELLGKQRLGGRQDFLRWSPHTWVQWDSMNLAYDASVGFADEMGFRAGTSYPFRPWLLSERRQADLLEIPLMVTDSALYGYLRLDPAQAAARLRDCVARCKIVGGVFTLAWHNTTMLHSAHATTYRNLLCELEGHESYDWRKFVDGSYGS